MNWQNSILSTLVVIMIVGSGEFVNAADLESSVAELADEIADQMRDKQAHKLAVVGFTDLNGYKSALGAFISEELITNLVNSGRFDIVERRELDRVLSEHEMYTEGIFDQSTIAELQKLLGIEAIITGSITNLGTQVKINARSISVQTGKIFAAASITVDKDPVVEHLLNQATNSGSASDPGSRGFAVQRSDVYFKNSFLHVVLTGITATTSPSGIQIATEFRNTTNKPLLLATPPLVSRDIASIMSDAGDLFQRGTAEVVGLNVIPYSNYTLGVDFSARGLTPATDPRNYTVIDPGSHATVLIKFRSQLRNQKVKGRHFSFTVELVRLTNNGVSNVSVGLSGVELN